MTFSGMPLLEVELDYCVMVLREPFNRADFNGNFREAVDYDVSTTAQIGWSYLGTESGRRLRFGLQYGKGPTSQYEFFTRREEYFGIGTWFDY